MFELYVFDVMKIKNSDITDGSLVKVKNLPTNMILLHIWRHQRPQTDILPRAPQNLSAALGSVVSKEHTIRESTCDISERFWFLTAEVAFWTWIDDSYKRMTLALFLSSDFKLYIIFVVGEKFC